MDEKELETLFRAAPGDPPPPGFSLADVTTASARANARRRTVVLMSAVCAVLLVSAAGIVGLSYFRSTETPTAQPAAGPAPTSLQGSGPRAEGASGCEQVDRELATALAGEFPATAAAEPAPGRDCPTGARVAGFHVTDGDRTGVVSVTLVPAGTPVPLGATAAQHGTASGGTLVVTSSPDPGSAPPFQSDLPRIATALSTRF